MTSDVDLRTLIDYEDPQPDTDESYCTICAQHGDYTLRTDLTVTKHHWSNRDAGQLITRCPDHQTYWEQQQHEAGMTSRRSGG